MSAFSAYYHRRASVKSASKPVLPTMIAFRNAAGEIQYTMAPVFPSDTPHATPQQTPFAFQSPYEQSYDSDGEPLLPSPVRSHNYNDLTEEERTRFTATGGPLAPFASSTLQSWGGDMFTVPQYLPKQYTDDSIIPVIVTNVIRTPKPVTSSPPSTTTSPEKKKRRNSIANMFKSSERVDKDDGKPLTKVVFMPRRDYLKWFAKNEKGDYIGTEPKKEWTDAELEERFGEYRPNFAKGKQRRNTTAK